MTGHRLNTAKLARDIDEHRGAGKPWEISYRDVGREVGAHSSVFTRLHRGLSPRAEVLISLLMWLNPEAKFSDYALAAPAQQDPAITRVAS